jgi:hypothetical protein
MTLNQIAEEYVKLALAVGRHDSSYVDAYIGPPSWQTEVQQAQVVPLPDLSAQAAPYCDGRKVCLHRRKISMSDSNF